MQQKILPPLPTKKVSPPWDTVLQKLASSTLVLWQLEPGMRQHLDFAELDLYIALCWVIQKKWHHQLKIPVISRKHAPKRYVRLLEPRGELLWRILELCEACYDSSHPQCQPYSSPAHWYYKILAEGKTAELQDILDNEPQGKKLFVHTQADQIKQLKNLKNPLEQEIYPHFYALIAVALVKEKEDQFEQQNWKPFLKAYSGYIQSLDSPQCHEAFVNKGALVHRFGKGQATKVLS